MPDAPEPSMPAPSVPGPDAVVLPPLTAPSQTQAAGGESQMTLMSPAGMEEGDETDWAAVVGVALVAEIGLLWAAACIALWRRRIALGRARSGTPEDWTG
ncbi:hypothetical protein [Spirillospora sp. CA-128828]|uniref:hypothetical protein n=1 Tax=Spirillospora sp. CA-128828 TaxID=3240033 RepID=UPI003D8AA081